jgi:hypothetical protein
VALLQFDGAPSNPSVAGDITHSLWQRNEIAIRAEYPIRWKLARPGSRMSKNDHTYTCEQRFWDEGGTEAQILEDAALLVSRRFEQGWQTLQWAEEERKRIDSGVG